MLISDVRALRLDRAVCPGVPLRVLRALPSSLTCAGHMGKSLFRLCSGFAICNKSGYIHTHCVDLSWFAFGEVVFKVLPAVENYLVAGLSASLQLRPYRPGANRYFADLACRCWLHSAWLIARLAWWLLPPSLSDWMCSSVASIALTCWPHTQHGTWPCSWRAMVL